MIAHRMHAHRLFTANCQVSRQAVCRTLQYLGGRLLLSIFKTYLHGQLLKKYVLRLNLAFDILTETATKMKGKMRFLSSKSAQCNIICRLMETVCSQNPSSIEVSNFRPDCLLRKLYTVHTLRNFF